MLIEPIFFYILISSVFFLSTLLVILVWWQISVVRSLLENKKKVEQLDKKAKAKAEKILRQAEINRAELSRILEKRLEKVSQALLKDYQASLSQSLKKVVNNVSNISKDIEKQTRQRLEAEVEGYKKTRLEKVDEQIYSLVNEVAEEVLGKSLSSTDQEELIFQAIEKAKKKLWQTSSS